MIADARAYLSDLAAAEPMSAKREPYDPRIPGTGDLADKDRPINPMSGIEFARKRPEPVSGLWNSGRAPALHAASVS